MDFARTRPQASAEAVQVHTPGSGSDGVTSLVSVAVDAVIAPFMPSLADFTRAFRLSNSPARRQRGVRRPAAGDGPVLSMLRLPTARRRALMHCLGLEFDEGDSQSGFEAGL